MSNKAKTPFEEWHGEMSLAFIKWTPREPTVGNMLHWLDKLSKLESDGAKVIHLRNLIERNVLAERERCAKIAEQYVWGLETMEHSWIGEAIAAKIREGKPPTTHRLGEGECMIGGHNPPCRICLDCGKWVGPDGDAEEICPKIKEGK